MNAKPSPKITARATLGIDFGTANTYLSECAQDELKTVPLLLDDDLGKATANLYRNQNSEREIFLIGQLAINTFGTTPPAIRKQQGFELRTQYKPDIGTKRRSRDEAEDFFKKLLLGKTPKKPLTQALNPGEVIFGIPSNADHHFKGALKTVAVSTGFASAKRPVKMYPEPLGALVYHLSHAQTIAPRRFAQGVMIVDFGGGTCDFTSMTGFETRASWGDMLLGGRLFDDLFFRVFLEQNPSAQQLIEDNHDQHFIQFYECKQAKEEFSNLMQRPENRNRPFTRAIRPYGRVEIKNWEHFIRLARQYRPSDNIRQSLRNLDEDHPVLAALRDHEQSSIDLLAWFETALRQGLEKSQCPVQTAILTGGSSRWPFVTDCVDKVLKELGNHGVDYVLSPNPYIDVGEGLSMIPATQQGAQRDLESLAALFEVDQTGTNAFEELLGRAQNSALAKAQTALETAIKAQLNPFIRRSSQEFSESGGSLQGRFEQLQRQLRALEDELTAALSQWQSEIQQDLPGHCQAQVADDLARRLTFPIDWTRPAWPAASCEAAVKAALSEFVSEEPRSWWRRQLDRLSMPSFLVRLCGRQRAWTRRLFEHRQDLEQQLMGAVNDWLTEQIGKIGRDLRTQLESERDARKALLEHLNTPEALVTGE